MFYQTLSRFYDVVFPQNPAAVHFVLRHLPAQATVADAACGTGTMAIALAQAGMNCTAVDIEPEMVRQARQKDTQEIVDFRVGDMRDIASWGTFDGILCLGNSLSHLASREQLQQFFVDSGRALRPSGRCVFQIVNYDRILDRPEGVDLPTLGNAEVIFHRRYIPTQDGSIQFRSCLQAEGRTWEHSIALQPILSADFRTMLRDAGFAVELFGDYGGAPFDKQSSFSLIAVGDIG